MTAESTPEPTPESSPESSPDASPEPTVRHNPGHDRFEIFVGDTRAGLTQYTDHEGQRIYFHTEVSSDFEGQGLAAILVRQALDATRAEGLRIVAICPYVARYVRSHHDWDDVLDHITPEALQAVDRAVGA